MRVLLVDDSREVRGRIRSLLGEIAGTEVVGEAGTVREAFALAATCAPELVILDVKMPDGNGFEVLERVRGLPSPPKVVILTNYPDSAYRRRSAQLGAERFLDKSRDLEELRRLVAELQRELSAGTGEG